MMQIEISSFEDDDVSWDGFIPIKLQLNTIRQIIQERQICTAKLGVTSGKEIFLNP